MNSDLFAALGLDKGLPPEILLEELETKNLEYLERLDACTDEVRMAELRKTQEEIESTLQDLRSGVSLQKDAPKQREDVTSKTSSKTPAGSARKAQKKTPPPAGTAIPAQRTRREIFEAAQAGDGGAALELAQEYYKEDNYESAWKWGKAAHQLKEVGACQFLMGLYGKAGNSDELLSMCVEEIGRLTGYDQYSLCESFCSFLQDKKLSPQQRKKAAETVLGSLSPDFPARTLVEEVVQTAEEAIAQEKQDALRRQKDLEAREHARLAMEEQLEKKRLEEQSRQKAEGKERARQHFWKKIFPVIFCVIAPPLLAWGTHRLFWLIAKDIIDQPGAVGMIPLILMPLLPILVGWICYSLPYKLKHGKHSWHRWCGLKFSIVINSACLLILAIVGRAFEGSLAAMFPIVLGPLRITLESYYAYGVMVAFYIISVAGSRGKEDLADLFSFD